jgi:hypothetical protein
MESICAASIYAVLAIPQSAGRGRAPRHFETSKARRSTAAAQAAAETLGLTVHRSVTSGARVRDIPRDEAELAIEYLREWGFAARILEHTP